MQVSQHFKNTLDDISKYSVLSGIKPVLELLTKTPQKIDALFLRKGLYSKDIATIIDLCRNAGIRFSFTTSQKLNSICTANHQGVVARLFQQGFTDLEDLFQLTYTAPLPLILMFDTIQDPGNAGTLIRTLYALGGSGIIIPKHNGAFLGSGARRSASGTLEHIPIAKVTNLTRALEQADTNNFKIYGADISSTNGTIENAYTAPLEFPAILVLGNEEHGIRLQIKKRCHTILNIPMARETNSLNVAQAGGILISCFAQKYISNV